MNLLTILVISAGAAFFQPAFAEVNANSQTQTCTFKKFSNGRAYLNCANGPLKFAPYSVSVEFWGERLTKPFKQYFRALSPGAVLSVQSCSSCGGTQGGARIDFDGLLSVASNQGNYLSNPTFINAHGHVKTCGVGYELIAQ